MRRQLLGSAEPRYSGLTIWRANVRLDERLIPEIPFIAWWGPGSKFIIYQVAPGVQSWEAVLGAPRGGTDPPGESKRVVLDQFAHFVAPVPEMIEATDESEISRTDV